MQIVINIGEARFKDIQRIAEVQIESNHFQTAEQIIANGTPLPKGHGRLIDANRLRSMYSINRANFNTVVGIQKWIDDAPTIIEADRSEDKE